MTGGWRKPPGSPQLYVLSSNPKKVATHQDFEEAAAKCKIFPCLSPDSSYRAFAVAARACKEKIGGGKNSPCRKKTDKVMGAVGGMFWSGGFIFLLVFFLQILSGGLGEMLGILSWCMLLLDFPLAEDLPRALWSPRKSVGDSGCSQKDRVVQDSTS